MNNQRAILSNESNYTVFRVGDKVIRFRAPYSLEYYTEVKEWNHGYIVAMAKYKQNDKPEEEYSTAFYEEYFGPDCEKLVDAIKAYRQHNGSHKKDEHYLAELLR